MFRQTLVHAGPAGGAGTTTAPAGGSSDADGLALVTYLARSRVPEPVRVGGEVVLEHDSPAVWYTFPGAHHDIGRFHTPEGEFTGYYANILTPVEILPRAADGADVWRTTDLFLDMFVSPDGAIHTLDQDELREAVAAGHVSPHTAREAETELERLVREVHEGRWPPPVVAEWPLERARTAAEAPDRDPTEVEK